MDLQFFASNQKKSTSKKAANPVKAGNKAGKQAKGKGKPEINKIDDKYLKKQGIDAHELKGDFLGRKAKISQYDLYVDKKTGEIFIYKKGGKGEGIPTGEYIK